MQDLHNFIFMAVDGDGSGSGSGWWWYTALCSHVLQHNLGMGNGRQHMTRSCQWLSAAELSVDVNLSALDLPAR
jgi:hypothetical protein